MSVILFKDGASVRVEPNEVAYHLKQGWDPQNPDKPRRAPAFVIPPGTSPKAAEAIVLGAMHIRVG